ncbi:DUF5131 family protein [Streptomyces sp. NPDC048208]|uniref:DUF5131 family protein n=1 Tax=Streptomyces sp. NPDC048208 TaxID=3365515 RepID=UPI003716283B
MSRDVGGSIEWTEATWDPTTGCDRVSSGCDNCNALTLAKRLKAMGSAKYDGDPRTSGPGSTSPSIPALWISPTGRAADGIREFRACSPVVACLTGEERAPGRERPRSTASLNEGR